MDVRPSTVEVGTLFSLGQIGEAGAETVQATRFAGSILLDDAGHTVVLAMLLLLLEVVSLLELILLL